MKTTIVTAMIAAQAASGALIVRHDGHDQVHSTNLTGFGYPANISTAYVSSTSLQLPTSSLTRMTHSIRAAATVPSSIIGSHAPYTNATSTCWARYGSGMPGLPDSSHQITFTSTSNIPAPTPWDDLWPLHWPASSTLKSSTVTSPTSSITSSLNATPTNATFTIPILTARPNHPAKQSPAIVVIIPTTTMSTPALQDTHNAQSSIPDSEQYAATDPVIFDPGRLPLSSGDAQTFPIRIIVTISTPNPTPTTALLKESTMTSKITNTLTRTVRLSSMTPQPTSTPQSIQPEPTSSPPSNEPNVHTTIISADPRCPYPLPGVYCGDPKTTLVTEIRNEKASTTSAPTNTGRNGKESDGWCPYPGLKC